MSIKHELAITIFWSEGNNGYQYDIYNEDLPEGGDRPESVDGGLCTGSLSDALDMAVKQVNDLLVFNCPKCGSTISRNKEDVSDGYFGACLNCDEDFYKTELRTN